MNNNDPNELEQISSGPRSDRLQAADRIKLPRGAFVACRQSGGLRFSTREVTVYNDGRVIVRRQGKLGSGENTLRITPAEVAALKALITQSGLPGLPRYATIGSQSPDAYAYELIVRLERKSNKFEFFDGSIPAEVKPLLTQLKSLMTAEERG
jgi:hypothetical protein